MRKNNDNFYTSGITTDVPGSGADGTSPALVITDDGLTLVSGDLKLTADLAHMIPRIRPGRLGSELLVKAARIKGAGTRLTAVDATAGLGEDSLLLAAMGYDVRLYEYDHVIFSLLRDSLERASAVPELSDAVSRMECFEADSISALGSLTEPPDLIYLDPMFPGRQKSGLIKKKFQLLQQLEHPCEDEKALLDAAIDAAPRRIVIKRPAKGPWLAGKKPSYSLSGKTIRYDCIVLRT